MKRNFLITSLAAASLLCASLRAEESKFPPINPALLYWQAAAVAPKLSDEQATELRDVATGKKPVDLARLQALGLGSTEHLLRRAAESTAPCDWGLLREDGPAMLMPHLSKMREMANMATAQAEGLFAQGKTAEGLELLLATHRIARHPGAGETLISYLVQVAIEDLALHSAARHCLGWDEATRHGYAEQLKKLPPMHSLQEEYRGESVFIDWLERVGQTGGPEREAKLKQMFDANSTGNKEAAQQKEQLEKVFTGDRFSQEITAMRAMTSRIEAAFGKPWPEAEADITSITNEVAHNEFFLVKTLVPAVAPCFNRAAGIRTLQTMLDAALQQGPAIDEAGTAKYADAFDGKALKLTKGDKGALSIVCAEEHPKGKRIELKLGK